MHRTIGRYPKQVDWSMNHAAHRTDALSALKMNLGYGGKQSTPHESLMDPAHASLLLGPEPAFMSIGGAEVDCKLKPGDTQHFYFKPDDPPPWYKPGAPKYDRIGSEGKVLEQGYVDKPKGKKQVLWERGWWKEGMQDKLDEDDGRDMSLSSHHVLASCWDFANETTALMEKLRARGHILLMCVKCHPELAGVGIENTWGKSAIHFRRNNDCVAKNLDANVQNSLHSDNLPLRTIRKFARKTRDYLRAYDAEGGKTDTHGDVEKLRGTFKCHRSSLDFDFKFIRDA